MSEHPSAIQLEGWYTERQPDEIGRHIEGCSTCQHHVSQLEEAGDAFLKEESAAAFLSRPAIAAELNRAHATPKPTSRWWWALAPALAAAAVLIVMMRGPAEKPTPPEDKPDVIRFMGDAKVGVILLRDSGQSRRSGTLALRPGDGIRVELTLTEAGHVAVGVLERDGTWTPLMTDTLPAGVHVLAGDALFVTEEPTRGWILVGSPDQLAAAVKRRTTDSSRFDGLAVMELTWAGDP